MTYDVFISLLSRASFDKIVSTLVHNKMSVKLNMKGNFTLEKERFASTILSLNISTQKIDEKSDPISFVGNLYELFNTANIKHFGIIVMCDAKIAWHDSNIDLEKSLEERKDRITKATHLKLVPKAPEKQEESKEPTE